MTPGQSQPDVTVLRPELNCLAQDSMQLAAALLEHYLLPPPTPMSRAYHSNTSEPNQCGTSKGSQVNTHVVCLLGGAIHIYREKKEDVQVEANHMVQPLFSKNGKTNLTSKFLKPVNSSFPTPSDPSDPSDPFNPL